MMRLLVVAVVLVVVVAAAHGQTHVSGAISTHTTWDVAGSPYIVDELTEVINNSVLTIDPGVTVKFDGFYLFRATDGGSIYAEGTQEHRILFTSNSGTPVEDSWIWVGVYSSPASSFAYCDFEYGRKGLSLEDSSPTITHCSFNNIYLDGVTCQDSSPTIQSCDFHQTGTAIYVYSDDAVAQPVIHGCNLYDNSGYNIYLTGFADPPLVTIDAEGNWWGTSVEGEIESKIRHDVDVGTIYGHVDFDPWLYEIPVEALSWGRVKAMFAR